ncbi:MAG: hypothetical protein KAI79_20580 [Bacteroidales bacterium]|nr:hypothetical protein [Bacteroidales bacterium]
MIQELLSGMKGEIIGELTEKIGIPTDKMDDIMGIVGSVATTEVTKEATGGGIGNIMNLFSSSDNNSSANSLQDNIVNGVVADLISKLGIEESMAKMAAAYVVPMLMEKITGKNSETADDDASPITKMFGIVSSGDDGLMGKIGGFFS